MKDVRRDPGDDPLVALEALDLLEVGPVRVEPRSVTAPYRVVAGDGEHLHELTYRYEEDVFDPSLPGDVNLAAMITAQVALNYGLFCRRMVFNGPFDAVDRRFLKAMLANTGREIFVKKLLEPNPFLSGEVTGLRPRKHESFVRAEVSFPITETGPAATGPVAPPRDERREGEEHRYAVLSSGGKDSLLSFGLLEELGYEVHPIFINESGRHWFTALNAYRHFAKNVRRTSRVWTDSDRLFSAMLRHLPFIRSDFARLRADEYPIRLWTVAVFLFGALPLVRRRGLGRLVIGDEHDTSVRARHQGIPHYDGLYDQSRYFDDNLSRYYRDKGWSLTQLSLLRPLSELLIETTLAQRYPELLRLQTSCHAGHVRDHHVLPCGRCEKCRRIIGMLVAIDGDPAACGYAPDQVEAAAGVLVEKGVHQERPGVEHLAALLHEKGFLPEPRLGGYHARRHPEVVRLRFHPERSPFDHLPVDLRRPLYKVLLEHADGAVRRHGRQWIEIDLTTAPELDAPYPFDRTALGSGGDGDGYLWAEMTWPQARRRLKTTDTALLPVGATEQHGPHLPLDTDSFDADFLARRVAQACSHPRPLVLPLISYGVSYHHDDFAGTLSISNETLSKMVYEIGINAARNGITKLVIVNGHGGNIPALHFAAQMINRDARIFTCVDSGETSDTDIAKITETPNDVHAGEIETSTSLAVRPHLVRMSRARPAVPRFSSRYLDFTSQHSVGWYARTARISESGVMGDPCKASAEKGREIWRISIDNLVELVEHLKPLSLDEIYQRRY